MAEMSTIVSERVDDIPLLIASCQVVEKPP
jgi:hypothetical protein